MWIAWQMSRNDMNRRLADDGVFSTFHIGHVYNYLVLIFIVGYVMATISSQFLMVSLLSLGKFHKIRGFDGEITYRGGMFH